MLLIGGGGGGSESTPVTLERVRVTSGDMRAAGGVRVSEMYRQTKRQGGVRSEGMCVLLARFVFPEQGKERSK